jgi:hypothetical protein
MFVCICVCICIARPVLGKDALSSASALAQLEFERDVTVRCPLDLVPPTSDDDDLLLIVHFRLCISAMKFLLHYGVQHQSYPWKCCLLLEVDRRPTVLEHMKSIWQAVMTLESSGELACQALCKTLTLSRFQV